MDSCIDIDAFIKRLEQLESAIEGGAFDNIEKKL
ncbi:hypothetical protein AAIR98_000136 [Elusimicrobium simillimum]